MLQQGHCPFVIFNKTADLNHSQVMQQIYGFQIWVPGIGKRVIGARLQLHHITTFYDYGLKVVYFPSYLIIKNAMALNDLTFSNV